MFIKMDELSEIENLETSQSILVNRTWFVLTQRLFKFGVCVQTVPSMGDDDDDVIEVSHREHLDPHMLNQKFSKHLMYPGQFSETSNNVESKTPDFVDIESIRSERIEICENMAISDEKFRENCRLAMKQCNHYIYMFFFLEKLSRLVENISYILTVIVAAFHFEFVDIIIAVSIMGAITLLDTFGDWGRLREKYSHLHLLFRQLLNSKNKNRVNLYRKYAYMFGSDELFIDRVMERD